MKIFPYRYKKVSDNLYVRVSNHFHYSDFGVRGGDEVHHYGHRYVCTGTPGTGFIEHDSESHSYHDFVRRHRSLRSPSYWRMVVGKEPDYGREIARATEVMRTSEDARKRELLEYYTNALMVGRHEEEMERVISGVKRRMGHHHNKYMVSIITHYKRRVERLERDMEAVEYHVKDHYAAATYEAWCTMVDAFVKMACRCRRIWHHNDKRKDYFAQVFFDVGIFDFIRDDHFLPLMRDSFGVKYYFLPDAVIVARSSVDFDIVPLKTLTIVFQETAIEEPTELLSNRVGDAACMILVPDLKLTFYFNHARVVAEFVQAVDKLKETL